MRAHNSIPVDSESLDEVLMSAFAGGDRSAFDTLYSRHQVALLRFVRRMMGQRLAGESQEVLRQIWLRIVEERDEFGPANTSWRCWAFRIARGIALERLRLTGRDADYHGHDEDGDGLEAARMFGRLLREGADPEDGDGRSEEEEAFWRAAGRRLLTCLEELPDDERAAFLLRQQEDFGIDELAYMLGVEEDGVRRRLRSALGKLRGCMERYLSVLGATPAEDDSEAAEASDEQLRDPYLDEALASAPDVGAVLDWRVGKALLEQAHQSLLGSAEPDLDDLDGPPSSGRGLRYGVIALVLVAAAGTWYWLQQPGRRVRVESVAGGAASPAVAEPPAPATPATRPEPAPVAKADSRPAAVSESVPLIPELQALFSPKQPAADSGAAAPGSAPANSRPATPAAPASPPVATQSAPASPPAAAASASSRVAAAAAAAASASSSSATRAAPSANGASNAASGPAQAPTRNTATPAAAAAVVPPPAAPAAALSAAPTPRATAVAAATPPAAAPAAAAFPESLKPLAPAAPSAPSARQAAASQAVARVQPDLPPSIPSAKLAAPAQPPSQAATQPATRATTEAKTEAKTETKTETKAQPAAQPAAQPKTEAKAQPAAQPKPETATPSPPPSTQAVAMADRPRPPAPGVAAQPAGAGNASAPVPPVAAAPPAASVPANPPVSASSSTVRTDDTPPPTFDALSQWSRITITRRDGTTRTLTRAEAGDLNSLLGSAAIAAVGSKPLGGSPEWRATLERPNGEVLAVLEVASTTVRWREGRTPPATGIPSGLALAGLREAMSDAVRPPRPQQPARPIATEAAASTAETAEPAPQAGDKP